MDGNCIFKSTYGERCDKDSHISTTTGLAQIHSIINASKIYNDGLGQQLEAQLLLDPDFKVNYHKNCISKCMSKTNVSRAAARQETDEGPSVKKLRHMSKPFDFKLNCLYCG